MECGAKNKPRGDKPGATSINNRGGCALPKVTPPTSSARSPPHPGVGGVKERSPCSRKIPDSPSPTPSGRGTEGSPRENWDLTLITATHCKLTPGGRGGNSCRVSRTFHFPVDRNRARATPTHRFPPPEPHDRHRNQFWDEGGRAQGFPNALSREYWVRKEAGDTEKSHRGKSGP